MKKLLYKHYGGPILSKKENVFIWNKKYVGFLSIFL